MAERYTFRIKKLLYMMFFFCLLCGYSPAESPKEGLAYYAGINGVDFFLGAESSRSLVEMLKEYTKEFKIDFFKISDGKDINFGIFESGKNFIVIHLGERMPYLSSEGLQEDVVEISGVKYSALYDLEKGLILIGDGKLILSNEFGKFLSQAENLERKGYLSGHPEILEDKEYEYFTYEKLNGEFYGRKYNEKIFIKNRDEKRTYYYLDKREALLDNVNLSGYIPNGAKVESSPGYELLKKILFGGLSGLEVDSEFFSSKLEKLLPLVTYRVESKDGSYLLVYANGVEKLKKTLKEIYSSLLYYKDLEVFSEGGYNFVEIPIINVKKYFLKLGNNLFALTDSANLAASIKNGQYKNSKYKKLDLNVCNFGNELVRFYEDRIEVVER